MKSIYAIAKGFNSIEMKENISRLVSNGMQPYGTRSFDKRNCSYHQPMITIITGLASLKFTVETIAVTERCFEPCNTVVNHCSQIFYDSLTNF